MGDTLWGSIAASCALGMLGLGIFLAGMAWYLLVN